MTEREYQRRVALIELIEKYPQIPQYRYTCEGSAYPDRIKHDLGTAYVERRRQEIGGQDISCVVSIHRQKLLRKVVG